MLNLIKEEEVPSVPNYLQVFKTFEKKRELREIGRSSLVQYCCDYSTVVVPYIKSSGSKHCRGSESETD